jgi:hypothetical protein
MYVQRNTEARSYKHCFSGKAMRITHCARLCGALVIQHVMLISPYCY